MAKGSLVQTILKEPRAEAQEQFYELERQQRRRKAMTGLSAAALGLTAYGFAKKNPVIMGAALPAAFLAGLERGRTKQKERKAIGKLKGFYSLRDRPRVIHPVEDTLDDIEARMAWHLSTGGDVPMVKASSIPGITKEAVIGGLLELLLKGNPIPILADAAAVPFFGRGAGGMAKQIAHATAKKGMGRPLSTKGIVSEETLARWGEKGLKIERKGENLPRLKKWYHALSPANKPAQRGFHWFTGSYAKPLSIGATSGEIAAPIIKEIEKVNPKRAELMLKALKGGENQEHLMKVVKRDFRNITKAKEEFKGTELGKFLETKGVAAGTDFVKQHSDPAKYPGYVREYAKLEKRVFDSWSKLKGTHLGKAIRTSDIDVTQSTPEEMVKTVEKLVESYVKTEEGAKRALVGAAIGSGLIAAGHSVGSKRDVSPTVKNELIFPVARP